MSVILIGGEKGGTGKTTLLRCLLAQHPEDVDIALIINPRLNAVELLASICDELRIDYPVNTDSLKVLVDTLTEYLLSAHSHARRTVVVIDEAQNLFDKSDTSLHKYCLEDIGMVCGGSMTIFLEPLMCTPSLIIFGAGHIGAHLCQLGKLLGFTVTVVTPVIPSPAAPGVGRGICWQGPRAADPFVARPS